MELNLDQHDHGEGFSHTDSKSLRGCCFATRLTFYVVDDQGMRVQILASKQKKYSVNSQPVDGRHVRQSPNYTYQNHVIECQNRLSTADFKCSANKTAETCSNQKSIKHDVRLCSANFRLGNIKKVRRLQYAHLLRVVVSCPRGSHKEDHG